METNLPASFRVAGILLAVVGATLCMMAVSVGPNWGYVLASIGILFFGAAAAVAHAHDFMMRT